MTCGRRLAMPPEQTQPKEERTMITLARNAGGLWIAIGTGIGTAVGVTVGYASVGLAVGVAVGVVAGLLARR
jgi:hypothetical protein